MKKGKVSVYPCVGGPLDGQTVTEDYAYAHSFDYRMFNSSVRTSGTNWKNRKLKNHSAILVHKSIYEYEKK